MKTNITKVQTELLEQYFNEHKEEILARITTSNDEGDEPASEGHAQGGTQLNLLDECGSSNMCVKAKKRKNHRPKYKKLGANKLRIHNGVSDNSGNRHWRITFNSVISKDILENNLKFVSVQRELSTDDIYLWVTEEDYTGSGVCFNTNGINVTIDNKHLILRIMGALGIHKKTRKYDLSVFWEKARIPASGFRFILGIIDKGEKDSDAQ